MADVRGDVLRPPHCHTDSADNDDQYITRDKFDLKNIRNTFMSEASFSSPSKFHYCRFGGRLNYLGS